MNEAYEPRFSDALSEFILNMEQLPAVFDHPDIRRYSEKLCRLLKISLLEVIVCSPPENENIISYQFSTGIIFSDGDPDNRSPYILEHIVSDGSRVEYKASPYAGAGEWTDEEKRNIEVFVKTLFVFTSRAKMMDYVENSQYIDFELQIRNMNYLSRFCNKLLKEGRIYGFTCCRFNLKRFSIINRRFGRDGGTEIMKKYISELSEIIGDEGVVCRMGGDNFAALFPNEKTEEVKKFLIEATISTGVNGLDKISISARAGYYPITQDCRSAAMVFERVSAAEAIANNHPGLPYVYYDEKAKNKSEADKWIEGLFPDAVKNEEFLVYYQPKINLNDYTLTGVEALCRWKHKGELISPVTFIPIFEQTSNICLLDFYMLEHVCRDLRRWLDSGFKPVKVSVHMSRINLGSEDLAERIIEIVNRYSVPKEYIEIELKETVTDVDFSELRKVVTALHKEGISTSIDSFGVRYSSLRLIRELPWDVLKIDKSLLPDDIDEDGNKKKIILKHLISLAHSLGLECIAEGVETIDQIALLKESGCFKAQGYYFDRPLPVEQFERIMNNNVRTPVMPGDDKYRSAKRNVEYFDELLDNI